MSRCNLGYNQSQSSNSAALGLGFFARRAVVAAPPALEEGDALAPWRILTRRLAFLEVGNFVRRLLHVYLTGVRVACGLGTDLLPRAR